MVELVPVGSRSFRHTSRGIEPLSWNGHAFISTARFTESAPSGLTMTPARAFSHFMKRRGLLKSLAVANWHPPGFFDAHPQVILG